MNTFTISGGRLVKDAEVKKTKEGREYLTFTVADNDPHKDKEKTLFFNCMSNEPASISEYLTKGTMVNLIGYQRDNTYVNKDGIKIHGVNFIVLKTDIIFKKNDGENSGGGGGYQKKPAYSKPTYQKQQPKREEPQEQQNDDAQEFSDDSVPF